MVPVGAATLRLCGGDGNQPGSITLYPFFHGATRHSERSEESLETNERFLGR
ncbi:MAG: hypothetical protein Fur005_15690 [Roseiflexaceae bacterium]